MPFLIIIICAICTKGNGDFRSLLDIDSTWPRSLRPPKAFIQFVTNDDPSDKVENH